MSSPRSVSAVTAAIRGLLDLGLRDDPPGTVVTARPPGSARASVTGNQLNVFLYQASINAAWRNNDMPRRVNPGESGAPPLPLTLHYLLTAYGENDEDVIAHHVLGRTMSVLHDHPILSPDEIRRALGPTAAGAPILDQSEGVRVTFQPMTLEEVSKLWTTLQTEYRISVTYQVSVLLIDSTNAARAALPVLRQGELGRGPTAVPDLTPPYPALKQVLAPVEDLPAELGDTLVLSGHHLTGAPVEVHLRHPDLRIDHVLPPLAGATAEQLSVRIPNDAAAAAAWPAGLYEVSIVTHETVGTETVTRATDRLPLRLAARLRGFTPSPLTRDASGDARLTVTFAPELRRDQRAALLIGDREVLPEPVPGTPASIGSLDFVIRAIAPGDHWLRLRVAGVDSNLVDRTSSPRTFDVNQRVTVV